MTSSTGSPEMPVSLASLEHIASGWETKGDELADRANSAGRAGDVDLETVLDHESGVLWSCAEDLRCLIARTFTPGMRVTYFYGGLRFTGTLLSKIVVDGEFVWKVQRYATSWCDSIQPTSIRYLGQNEMSTS